MLFLIKFLFSSEIQFFLFDFDLYENESLKKGYKPFWWTSSSLFLFAFTNFYLMHITFAYFSLKIMPLYPINLP